MFRVKGGCLCKVHMILMVIIYNTKIQTTVQHEEIVLVQSVNCMLPSGHKLSPRPIHYHCL